MISSRQKPPSPRTAIRTAGHRARIRDTIRASSPTVPSAASTDALRSRAHSRCSPQNTYSGR